MTTALKPEVARIMAQGPTWEEARRGEKEYNPDQPRDELGRWGHTPEGEARKWEYDPRDTPQQRTTLQQDRAAQSLRAEYPSGTRVVATRAAGIVPKPDAARGTVDRTIPGRNALGGYLLVDWDSGASGRIDPGSVVREDRLPKFAPDQPRDDHGRFVDTGNLGNVAIVEGGFSVSLRGDNPSGWMVSQAGTERSFDIESLAADEPTDLGENPVEPWHDNVKTEISSFVREHRDDLGHPGVFLGGWVDEGRLYLDVSHSIQDKDEAMAFAEENDQLAAFNADTGEYVRFDQKSVAAREKEKVFLDVAADDDADEIAERMIRALFG